MNKYRKVYKILFIAWTTLIVVLTSIPDIKAPVKDELNLDKLFHFLAYLIIAFLFVKMYHKNFRQKAINKLYFLTIIIPVIDEVHQIPIPGRNFSLLDVVADILGMTVIIIYFKLKSKN